jgi:hypothetical protein
VELFFLHDRLVSVSVDVDSPSVAARSLTAKYGPASGSAQRLSWQLDGGEIVLTADRKPAGRSPASTRKAAYVLYTSSATDDESNY